MPIDLGQASLDAVARVAAVEAGWSDTETADQIGSYLSYIEKFHTDTGAAGRASRSSRGATSDR